VSVNRRYPEGGWSRTRISPPRPAASPSTPWRGSVPPPPATATPAPPPAQPHPSHQHRSKPRICFRV